MKLYKLLQSWINNNFKILIETLCLFPSILVIHTLCSALVYSELFTKDWKQNSIFISLLTIALSGMLISFTLIILVLMIKQKNEHIRLLITLLCFILPITLANNFLDGLFLLIADLIITYNLVQVLNKFNNKIKFTKITISEKWVGFWGTVLSAIISATISSFIK